MGYTIPGWLDEILDFIGINFPNVDEDDFREMGTAMREFADNFEGKGGDAHQAVTRILSSSQGWAVDAMEKHWSHVKAGHLDKIPELARLFADACDVVADIVYGMKIKAEIELGAMAASVGISLGLAAFTGGLSALLGAAEITAMRQAVKRIVDEAADRIVDELVARVTEPVNAKLEKMVEDAVLDLAEGAFSLPPEPNAGGGGGGTGKHGHGGGMQLASAGGGAMMLASAGGGPGGGVDLFIDHVEFEDGADKVSRHGGDLHTAVTAPLERAKGHFGRTKGKDAFTAPFESVLEGALKGSEKAVKKVVKHLAETVPDRVKATSRLHKGKDIDAGRRANNVHVNSSKSGNGSGGHHGAPASGRKPDPGLKIDSSKLSQQARELDNRPLCGDPIDMSSGQMVLAQTDADLPGILPLTLRRTHLSGYDGGRFFGPSWASTLDERLEENKELGGIWWYREDGSILVYPRRPDLPGDRVNPAEGTPLPLTYVTRGTTYVLTTQDPRTGLMRHFEPSPSREGVWWLSGIEDRNGNTITFERADDDTPTEVTHTGGYHLRLHSDPERGRVTALHLLTEDGPVRLRAYRYDDAADLIESRNAVDAPLHLTYDAAHRITGWRDSNDTTFTYVYDARGRVTATHGSAGTLNCRIEYGEPEPDGTSVSAYTDSLGHTTLYRANHRGQIIAITDPLGATTTQTWDRHDRLLSGTDPLGRTTRWEWSNAGDLVRVTTPDGATTRIVYNALHLPVELIGPDGVRTVQEFDDRGNRTRLIAGDGAVYTFTYHATGALASVSEPLGVTTFVEADSAGRPTAITDPRNATTSLRYDVFGRTNQVVDALGRTTSLVWDSEGRLLQRTKHDGTQEFWTWDGEGNCTSHSDEIGGRTRLLYGPFGLPRARLLPNGTEHRYEYDTEQRLTSVTNGQGLTWRYTYDAVGQLISETDFDGRTTTYAYDAAGQPTRRTNAAGETITYTFDEVGRLSIKSTNGTRSEYIYDEASRLIRAATRDCTLEFSYDAAGRLTSQSTDGAVLRFTYNRAGRRQERTTPSGAMTTWTDGAADNAARMIASGRVIDFFYDAAGRDLGRRIGQFLTLTNTYAPSGRLSDVTVAAGPGQRLVQRRTYTYRADGHITGIDDLNFGARHFDLDPAGRVKSVHAPNWNEEYSYDAMGNQTMASWPAHHGDPQTVGPRTYIGTRISRAGNVRYEHDASGRIVQRQKVRLSRKPDTWRYEWNAEDQLVGVTTPDGTRWRYTYDALGRRSAKLRLADDGETVCERTTFIWDGATLCEQSVHKASSSEVVTITWDHNDSVPVAQLERKSLVTAPQEVIDERFFAIITDHIGTPTELVNEEGAVAWRTRATLWGATAWNREATAYTPLRFPGQYYDWETGLHYNYYRYYDPEAARYLSPDPLGLLPAPNPLAYVDNPLSLSDPLGLKPCDEGDVTWGGRVQYGQLGPHNRATSMHATIAQDMLGGKTSPQVDPAGWESGKGYNRAHLLAAMIGGSNKDPRNFVTMHSYANSPVMRQIELQIRNAVKDGEIILYSVIPIYADDKAKIPLGVTIEAYGSKGFEMRPHGSDSGGTNSVTIWNRKR
ncbi:MULTISPECIES: RHS repeat-associated core domain-containing protein [Streptomyces]|uniref:Type IV secretion protein Rhs n=2 Tax=Streptomyces TaxID=1883 RepID=A0A2U9P311_STRAS|nr:RHS repeat-associated core domain-containing protein [Streptomyces actuosus]AWT44090.1 type IV secretion protein Rhs [Streptomyces actuosus]MBM4820760.1 RHS repeat protein [Streptomyces actuosus]